jgi:ribonuclease P protein component
MLPKQNKLTSEDLKSIPQYSIGQKKGEGYTVKMLSIKKFGVIIPKKPFGNRSAVRRHRLKRQIFRILKSNIETVNCGLLIIIKSNSADFGALRSDMLTLGTSYG